MISSRHKLHVKKRDGSLVPVSYDAITNRLTDLCDLDPALDISIDPRELTEIVIKRIKNGISTSEIDTQIAEICSSMIEHPDYSILASRLVISNHHRDLDTNIGPNFSDVCITLYHNKDKRNRPAPLISESYYKLVLENKEIIDNMVDLNRDYLIDYFGFKTLYKSYFLKVNCIYNAKTKKYNEFKEYVVECPQYLFLRYALNLHKNNFKEVKETYDLVSNKYFTPATPTLFNSGTPRPQLFSCFLLNMADSMDGIYKCISDTAKISKWAGGIGISISDVRSSGSYISGTAGQSDGIVPMLKVLNDTARYVNQGGRRNGSFAVYLEPWHADVFEFLECRLNHGSEEMRAKDLFYALWIPDLFMSLLEKATSGQKDIEWYLMDPNECPDLTECYGIEFEKKYLQYVSDRNYKKSVKILDLWTRIINTQIETGLPYMLYKDAVNVKSNHKNLGTIKSSNLCVAPETKILTDKGHIQISTLKDKEVHVWNGLQWSKVTVKHTGHQKLLKVTCSNGSVLHCTEYHKFFILFDSKTVIKEAKDLKKNMRLVDWKIPDGTVVTVKIVSVEDLGRIDDTYCFTEPLRNAGIFNGLLTMNCCEITEYNTPEKYACCCLSSVILPSYVSVNDDVPFFDYNKLYEVVRIIVRNLDITIDINFYPVPETEVSNMSERPLGIGVQGLADVFFKMRVPYDSKEAAEINKKIFETMYFAALTESCKLASEKGTYPSYKGSPASKNLLQFDLWSVERDDSNWPWSELREQIARHGLRNSLLIALMPTASTAQIFGSVVECFEPLSSNVYTRRVLAGEFIVFNKYLTNDLIKLGLWNKSMANKLKKYKGSIQHIRSIPQDIKNIYKTAWEIKQKVLIDMSADRGPYVDQSQSLNLFFERPTYQNLTSAHIYGWKKGLKTGSYYIRSKPATSAEAFTVTEDISDDDEFVEKVVAVENPVEKVLEKRVENAGVEPVACDMCS